MDSPWTSIAAMVGGGGALTLVAAILVFVTRHAIAVAVTHAGAQEIERLMGRLAGELEKERQEFSRELERERERASRALEQFKSQLTLDAEMRRQVASARVAAVSDLMKKGTQLLWCVGSAPYYAEDGGESLERLPTLCGEFSVLMRDGAHLFPATVADRLSGHGRVILEAVRAARREASDEAFRDAYAAVKSETEKMSAYARDQLFSSPESSL